MWHVSGSVWEGDHLNSLSVVMLDWLAFTGRSVYRLKVLIDNEKGFFGGYISNLISGWLIR